MFQTGSRSPRRLVPAAAGAVVVAMLAAACGSAVSPAPASQATAPSVAPSVAVTPSPSPSPSPSAPPSVAPPSTTPSATAEDPAKDLKIATPYTLVELDPALTQYFRNQMNQSIGAFGGLFTVGLRQVNGGKGVGNVLIVMGFPTGTLDDKAYAAVLTGITGSMGSGSKLTASTVEGVEVSSGTITQGTIAAFHIGDHLVFIVSSGAEEALPIAKAVVSANN